MTNFLERLEAAIANGFTVKITIEVEPKKVEIQTESLFDQLKDKVEIDPVKPKSTPKTDPVTPAPAPKVAPEPFPVKPGEPNKEFSKQQSPGPAVQSPTIGEQVAPANMAGIKQAGIEAQQPITPVAPVAPVTQPGTIQPNPPKPSNEW